MCVIFTTHIFHGLPAAQRCADRFSTGQSANQFGGSTFAPGSRPGCEWSPLCFVLEVSKGTKEAFAPKGHRLVINFTVLLLSS